MSIGFNALDENRFGEAQTAFWAAVDIDSSRPEAQQALDQLSSRRSQYNTDRALKTAFELESMEEWQKAMDVYDTLIAEVYSKFWRKEPRGRIYCTSIPKTVD